MAESIIDGTGTGKQMKVNSKNQASVASVNVEEVTHISSVDKRTFQFHAKRTLLAANTFENVMHLAYTGEYRLQIDSVMLSREDVTLATSGQSVFELDSDVIYTSGGAIPDVVNLHLGSSNVSDVTIYSGATTIVADEANEKALLDVAVETSFNYPFKGSLILEKGDTFFIKGKSLNIGDTLHVALLGYVVQEVI